MARALLLTLKTTPQYELDMSPVIPEKLAGKTLEQIKTIKLSSGHQKIALGTLFNVQGKCDQSIQIVNSHPKLNRIGQSMSFGDIEVTGRCGHYLGSRMTGGTLSIKGNVGDWLGANMKGGQITVSGNAGDFIGAGQTGEMQGMAGGLIVIKGNAGDRVGDRMRRGTIFITKNAGDYIGSRMIAGSLIVLGRAGRYSGYAMKRGTIILTQEPEQIAATFENCGKLELVYLRLLFKQFAQMGQPLSKLDQFSPTAIRFAGDLSKQGLGEILLLQ